MNFHCVGVIAIANVHVLLCEAQSACIAYNARGSGDMPPRKFLKNRCSEIESEGILESIIYLAT